MKNWKKVIFPVLAAGFVTVGTFGLTSPASAQVFVNPYYGGTWYDYNRGYYDPYVYNGYWGRRYASPYVGWYGDGYGYWYGRHHRWSGADTANLVGTILDYVF